jgi:hypothetical protein
LAALDFATLTELKMPHFAVLLALPLVHVAAWNVARTPPMAFNSWNLYGCGVTGQILMDTASAMNSSGLLSVGVRFGLASSHNSARARAIKYTRLSPCPHKTRSTAS